MTAPPAAAQASGLPAFGRLLAHEARTPLNAIRGVAELLLAGGGGPLSLEVRAHLGSIATAARRLEGVVAALIELDAAMVEDDGELDFLPLLAEMGFLAVPEPGSPSRLIVTGGSSWRRLLVALHGALGGRSPPQATLGVRGARVELMLQAGSGDEPDGLGEAERTLAARLARHLGVVLEHPDAQRAILVWPLLPER